MSKPDITLTLDGTTVLARPRLGAPPPAIGALDTLGLRRIGRTRATDVFRAQSVIQALRAAGAAVSVSDALLEKVREIELRSWLDLQAVDARLEAARKELAAVGQALRPYQRVGARWLASRPSGALLGDDMGLGKTVQVLCALPAAAPVLVVCPAKVKGEWLRQTKQFRPSLAASTLDTRAKFRFPRPGEILVCSYDVLPEMHEEECPRVWEKRCPGCSPHYPGAHRAGCDRFRKVCPGCVELPTPHQGSFVVFDEAHYIKNPEALRTESCRAIGQRFVDADGRRIGLTGTPLMNRPDELWHSLDALGLAAEAFDTWSNFKKLFAAKPREVWTTNKKTGQKTKKIRGLEWGDPLPEAPERLSRVMLRRLRGDVLQDLPEKSYKLIPVKVDRAALRACDKLLAAVGGLSQFADLLAKKKLPFELVSEARAALAAAKIPAMLEIVESYEESETPLVVFSAHRAPVDLLIDRDGWKTITGEAAEKPADVVAWFQDETNDVRGLGCTIGAAGTGLTLTRASHMLFVDQAWTPAQNEQAEARCLRLGQRNAVLVNVLVADHPLDERLAELLTQKRELFDAVVNGAAARVKE